MKITIKDRYFEKFGKYEGKWATFTANVENPYTVKKETDKAVLVDIHYYRDNAITDDVKDKAKSDFVKEVWVGKVWTEDLKLNVKDVNNNEGK